MCWRYIGSCNDITNSNNVVMVVYTKLTINGVDYGDSKNISVDRSVGQFNATSNFTVEFHNIAGKYDNTFSLNDEVVVYADLDSVPSTTKLFTGVIENIGYKGSSIKEKLILTGRDYGAVLQDMTVQPIVFKDRDAGEIAKIIVETNALGIVTTNNVVTLTGTTIDKIGFNHRNIFDALKELAELSEYYFYIDEDKDVHFEAKAGTSSGKTFDNTNITDANFTTDDSQIFNKVWVYGDRILTGATETGGIGAGSVFTLTDKPHNSRVFVDSTLQETGGIIDMNDPETTSGLKYVLDFNQKKIVFVSGLAAGDNIPASGAANVQVDYERSTPLLKFVQDGDSIDDYGPKTKIISDASIKDYSAASDKAATYLAEHKDPIVEGKIKVHNVINVTPGNTAIVNIPFHNIINQTYDVLNANYKFSPENNQSNKVMSLTLNKKISDFTDTMKDQMLRMRNVEAGPLEGNLTRLEASTGSIDVQHHWETWGGNIGSNFVFQSAKHGLIQDSNSRIGYSDAGSILFTSGGDF